MLGLSLFTGIGGLDLAFEAAGGRVIAMTEIDPFCRRVLAKHWPNVPVFDDVFNLTGDMVKEVMARGGISKPTVDIIFGGFPC